MLRSSVCKRSLQSLRARAVSTSVPPKQSIPTPPQNPNKGGSGGGGGGGVTLVLLATLGGIGYAAYQAEIDPVFDAQAQKVPGAEYVLNPFRKAIQLTGLVTKHGQSVKDTAKEPKEAAVTTHTPEKTTPKPVDPYVELNKAVVAELNGTDSEQQTDRAPTPETVDEEPQQTQNVTSDQKVAEVDEAAPTAAHPEPESAVEVAGEKDVAAPAPQSVSVPAAEAAKPTGVKLFGVPPEEAARLTESKVLKQALADSAREFIALRRDVEATLLKDIHSLSEHDLRIRIKQLATEMFERLAWEDVRMTQSLKGVQAELTEKYTDLMKRQQKELELEVNKIIFALQQETALKAASQVKQMEATYQKQLEDTVRAQAEGFHATLKRELEEQSTKITTELQDQLNHEVALLRKSQVDELLALQPQVQELHAQLEAVKHAADATAGVIKKTIDIHHLSAAVLSLELALSTPPTAASGGNQSIEKHLGAVRAACQGDEVVSAVLASLPRRVATSGALSLSDLQVRFGVMREEARKAALAPEAAPKMIGQLIGTALAAISIAPTGLVSGNGVEETLARAAYYLERGRLADTLRELDGVEGYAQVLMQDWKELARERLIVDQSIRVLKANAVIRHKAFK